LLVTVQGKDGSRSEISAHIYDWQLVPIARFAASSEGAAMTLFGSLDDEKYQSQLVRRGGRAINYHPAFDNTLMGLRLMQADIMLFDENAVYLPRDSRGYVLGAGESLPDVEENKRRFSTIRKVLQGQARQGHTYRSYVTGDLGQQVEFFVKNGQLGFSGLPYWQMWDDLPDVKGAVDDLRYVEAEDKQALIAKYGPSLEIREVVKADRAILEQWEAEGNPVRTDFVLSALVSREIASLGGVNPVAYDALKVVMRYGALFRSYKNVDASGYASFVESLDGVRVSPPVITPTVQKERHQ
jgi:hypothetical protein